MYMLTADYKEQLLKYIDASQLPAYLGGTLTDPDGNSLCPSMVISMLLYKHWDLSNNNVNASF